MPNFTISTIITAAQTLDFKEQGEVLFGGSLITAASAVNLADDSVVFINNGTVISHAGVAITGLGTAATIINTGFMSSKFSTISLQDTGIGASTITNSGDIAASGLFGNAISMKSGGMLLNNSGRITATGDPVILLEAGVAAETNVMVNTGLIANVNGLSIAGQGDADRITNTGTIIGDIQLGDGANRLRNAGSVEGGVTTGAGNDLIDLRGGFVAGTVNTGAGNDTLIGSAAGDRLAGGLGLDRLTGGAGADVFDFNTITTSITGARDVILDLLRGTDDIDLATIDARAGVAGNQAFVFIGTAAFSAEGQVRIIDLGANVVVQANRSGTPAADFEVMVLAVGTLTASDFIL